MTLPARDPAEVDRLLEIVRLRYGDRLGPEQLTPLREGIAAIAALAAAVRAVPLANGDEPLASFMPYRADA